MRHILSSVALLGAVGFAGSAALANGDGFYNVSYNDIGIELTQLGGYGELIIKPQGFKTMSYGTCTVNYTRDASGAVAEMATLVQGSSAKCPEKVAFSVTPGQKGMFELTFTEGGDLKGSTFQLFPVLRPRSEVPAIATPKGFDILGLTIGQSRAELEKTLATEGYARVEDYHATDEFTNGLTQVYDVWGRGEPVLAHLKAADQIAVTYSTTPKGAEDTAVIEALARKWSIPASENISVAVLRKSLDDKHGVTTSGFESRYYTPEGELAPKAFQPVCSEEIHLQSVRVSLRLIGGSEELSVSPACGAGVDVMVIESSSVAGLASHLEVKLLKADVAYDGFWKSWSEGETAELKRRYELQVGMTGAAPKL